MLEVAKLEQLRFYCFYTEAYKEEAAKMFASFDAIGIKVNCLKFGSTGNWMSNCMRRSTMLYDVYRSHGKDVCMVDSDLIAKQEPLLLFGDFDVACEFRGKNFPKFRQYSAGITVFKQTEEGHKTLRAWKTFCEHDEHKEMNLREQYYLKQAIETTKPRFFNLPNSYNAKPEQVNRDTVIVHNVASRRIRKETV